MEIVTLPRKPDGPFKVVKPVLHVAQWDGTRAGVATLNATLVALLSTLGADVVSAHHRVDTREPGGPRIDYALVRESDGFDFYITIRAHNWVVLWEGAGLLQDIEVIGASDGDRRFTAPVFRLPVGD